MLRRFFIGGGISTCWGGKEISEYRHPLSPLNSLKFLVTLLAFYLKKRAPAALGITHYSLPIIFYLPRHRWSAAYRT